MNPLPPDPYLALGVSKTAQIAEIRSAHRKLVLKCHPDKVQDEALKAIKQDEFQKVQQAYELLSDDTKRLQYDQHVKLLELRKEMGRGGPVGGGANVYYAEPRSTSSTYRKPSTYSSRYDSDDPKYSKRSTSYETKVKSSYREEERRPRRKEDVIFESRRDAEREELLRAKEAKEAKREKEAHADRKKSRDKERRKASEDKATHQSHHQPYIENDSDSEDIKRKAKPTRMKFHDIVEMATKAREDPRRTADRAADIAEKADRHREKTKAMMRDAIRYVKASSSTGSGRSTKTPIFAPDSPLVPPIEEEEDTIRRSSGRTTRRTSAETPSSSRRAQNSSRSRESPRLSSKDKKRSDPRMEDEFPAPRRPNLNSQTSAPPEIPSSRDRAPLRSNTMDSKYGSRGPAVPPLSRASTFNGNEKVQARSSSHRQSAVYESVSESSDSEPDTPVFNKQPSPTRQQRPTMAKTVSSYKIVKDINGQKLAAERKIELDNLYEEPRERTPSPRRPADYQRPATSRTAGHRAPPPGYAAQPIPVSEREREARIHTVRPGARETQQPSYSTTRPALYGEKIKVNYSPPIGHENISFSPQEYPRRESDPETRFASYPAVNPAYKREEPMPSSYRKMAYPVS